MNKRYIGSYKSKDNKKTGCVSGFGATSLKTVIYIFMIRISL